MAKYKGRHARRNRKKGIAIIFSIVSVLILGSSTCYIILKKTDSSAAPRPLPAAAPLADYQDTTETLCSPFEKIQIACEVEWKSSDNAPAGTLLEQNPTTGEPTSVKLVYASGPTKPRMPVVSGLTKEEAEKLIWNSGLKTGKLTEVNGAAARGIVLDSSQEAGVSLKNGTKIQLSISTGNITIPDWRGKSLELAQAEAKNLGLSTTVTTKESNETLDTIIEQPTAGKTIPFGEPIELVVAIGKASGKKIKIPDVNSMTQLEATALLATKGFSKITTNIITVAKGEQEKVIAVKPGVGEEVLTSQEILLTVEKPKE